MFGFDVVEVVLGLAVEAVVETDGLGDGLLVIHGTWRGRAPCAGSESAKGAHDAVTVGVVGEETRRQFIVVVCFFAGVHDCSRPSVLHAISRPLSSLIGVNVAVAVVFSFMFGLDFGVVDAIFVLQGE